MGRNHLIRGPLRRDATVDSITHHVPTCQIETPIPKDLMHKSTGEVYVGPSVSAFCITKAWVPIRSGCCRMPSLALAIPGAIPSQSPHPCGDNLKTIVWGLLRSWPKQLTSEGGGRGEHFSDLFKRYERRLVSPAQFWHLWGNS